MSQKNNLKQIKENITLRNIHGRLLVQEDDNHILSLDQLKVVTKEKIETNTYESILFGWSVLKYVKSNARLIVKDCTTIGVGAGQVSRIDSVDIAITKSKGNTDRSILLSDAFFPFRDSIDKIANTGIKTIVQPGGSVRDQDVVDACNEHSLAMVFTGARCFKH